MLKRLFLLALLISAIAFSQVNVTSIAGGVTDPTGAAVPAASIQVVSLATGEKFSAMTNDRGEYVVPALPAGAYRITVAKAGFKTASFDKVDLIVGVPGSLNTKLEVGAATETVQVAASAEIVQATTADVSSNLTGRQLTDLPFATRNAIELMVDLPGTATPTNPRSSSINGLPKGAMNITIDGMNTQDNMLKSSDGFFSYIMPSIDSLEEVTLQTSAAGVDSTSQGGAQIKFVTRSGTNTWHGGGFWQDRNTFFNANYFYNNQAGLPRDIVKLNQEGGHFGGPILKNKIFFFGNAEIYRFPGTNIYNRTYLTPSASSGVYTYVDAAGQTHNANLLALAAAANASLPSTVRPYSTTADPLLGKTYALMQSAGAGGQVKTNASTNDYNTLTTSYQPSGTDSRDFFTSRLDYLINSRNTLSLVYNYDWYVSVPDFLNNIVPDFPGTGSVLFSQVNAGQRSNRFDGTISLRSTISARMTNDFRVGLNGGTVLFFDLISPGLFSPWRGYVPGFASPGTGLSGVATNSGPQRRNAPVKNLADTVSWVKGSHQLSFGGNFDRINVFQQIEGNALFPGISMGIATNDPIFTGATSLFTAANLPGASSTQLSQAANLYADVVGRVSNISQGLALDEASHKYSASAPVDRDHISELGLFVSDQWRVRPNLTVNLGLRMEKQFPFVNDNNLYSQVTYQDLYGISGVGNLFTPGANAGQAPVYRLLSGDPYNPKPVWAPSIGIAWQAPAMEGVLGAIFGNKAGQTVLRGGYNIATVREGMNVYTGLYGSNQGLTIDDSVSPSTFPAIFGAPGSVTFSDANLPSRTSTLNLTPSYPIPSCSGCSMYGVDPHLKMGYVQSWNISLQRALGKDTVIDARYVGNHGTDLWRRMNLNEVNIYSNGFLNEFQIAQNNLTIARGGDINKNTSSVINFGNQGLPGQQAVPILQTAHGTTSDSTTATNLQLGQAGTLANAIAGNATRMNNLIAAKYPANFFQVNPLNGGSSNVLTNNGSSYFDAIQVEVSRRLSHGFQINGSYQFGKSLANGATASGTDSSSATTLRNLRLDRTPSSFDIRNALKFNWIYELPFGPGRAIGANAPLPIKKVLEGWQLSGVARFQSGTPFFISSFAQVNQNGSGVALHNITSQQLQSLIGTYKTGYVGSGGGEIFYLPPPPSAPNGTYYATLNSTNNNNLITNSMAAFNQGGLTPAQVNPSAPYIGPSPAGTMGWNGYFYLPWQRHFDLSLQKNTRISEHLQLQIAVHALDVLNFTNFLPNQNIGSSFGQTTTAYRDISGTVDPGARIIEWLVRLNF